LKKSPALLWSHWHPQMEVNALEQSTLSTERHSRLNGKVYLLEKYLHVDARGMSVGVLRWECGQSALSYDAQVVRKSIQMRMGGHLRRAGIRVDTNTSDWVD
jgi:hypothetical protein